MINEIETPEFIKEKKRLKKNLEEIRKDTNARTNMWGLFKLRPDVPQFDLDAQTVPIERYERPRKASFVEINPLLVIRSPRDIPEVKICYDKMNYIDKLWVKYYPDVEMLMKIREFVEEHKEYTHIILTSDDVFPEPSVLMYLINDVLTYDVPVISGCANLCNIWIENYGRYCDYCEKDEVHPNINVTFLPIEYKDKEGLRIGINCNSPKFEWVTEEFRKKNLGIQKCWYQGHAFVIIRRDIFMAIGCVPYAPNMYSDDFAFAAECQEHNIPQFVDFRAFMTHSSKYHQKLLVNKKPSKLIFENRETSIFPLDVNGKLDVIDYKPILVCTPFNNEEQSIDQFVTGMLAIDYPKELMDVIWIENDSVDNTWAKMQMWYKKLKSKYHSFQLIQQDYGLKRLGKATVGDFIDSRAGKNKLPTMIDRIQRGERLRDIYHFFFKQADKERHGYVFFLFADVVVPSNIVTRYLEVFKKYPDAGWVGGVHHKRFPYHMRASSRTSLTIAGIAGPLIKIEKDPFVAYICDEDILKKQMSGELIFEVAMTGHAWMVKPEIYWKGGLMGINNVEIIFPFIQKMWEMGLKVYCASDIYLQHISLDGKIYRHNLFEEIEKHHDEKILEAIAEEKLEKDTEYEIYLQFKQSVYPIDIPDRPINETRKIHDPLSSKIINQKDWDNLYGKWSTFIQMEKQKGEKI